MTRTFTPKEILDVLVDNYAESIFVTDGEGNVIFVNRIGAERLDSTIEDLMGRNVRDLSQSGVYQRSTTLIAIETKEPYVGTLNPGAKNSTVSNSIPVLDERGDVVMVVTNNMSVAHSRDWEAIISKEQAITEKLRRELDNIRRLGGAQVISESAEMKSVYANVDLIAPTDSNVVIIGESGTGKDVMARYIHDRSDRSGEAFISINCAAIPENLLESELFGYEAGAFTGALAKGKIGLFEAASGGTIFLDEIGEMSMPLQSKLLRALENREIRRVGGIKSIPIDARVICATNADLSELIREKKFREDLYYRLSVFTLHLPPLRDRKADILPLAQHFLDELNRKHNTHKYLSPEAIRNMEQHSWPGNIRELKNVVERIFVVSESDALAFTPMPHAILNVISSPGDRAAAESFFEAGKLGEMPLREFAEAAERNYIMKVIQASGGSVSKAAEKLGVHRSQIYRKLKARHEEVK